MSGVQQVDWGYSHSTVLSDCNAVI
jgi:hypothetical protein